MTKSGLISFFLLSCIILVGVIIASAEKSIQPIQYNHKLHVEEADLTCLDCHLNAGSQARASIPNIYVCGDCHDDIESENLEERKVAQYVSDGIDIPWIQVHVVPDHAYFSHRRHVTLGQLDCSECHGEVVQMETPFVTPINPIEMEWCTDCHEQREVTNECYSCHH